MIFITGPLASGKRTFAKTLSADCAFEVQELAAEAADAEALAKLADRLARREVVTSTEVGCGVVPVDARQRFEREQAGRLACLLAARSQCVVQMFCGIPVVIKGELPKC